MSRLLGAAALLVSLLIHLAVLVPFGRLLDALADPPLTAPAAPLTLTLSVIRPPGPSPEPRPRSMPADDPRAEPATDSLAEPTAEPPAGLVPGLEAGSAAEPFAEPPGDPSAAPIAKRPAEPPAERPSPAAPEAPRSSAGGPADAPSVIDDAGRAASDTARASYRAQLGAALERARRYPRSARRRRLEGVAELRFTVDRDGIVLERALVEGTGHAVLDEEALTLLERAAPLPPMPSGIGARTLTLNVPIAFRLDGG